MSHRYIPLTDQDKNEMLETIGAESISELFGDVPKDILLNRELAIPDAESETTLTKDLIKLLVRTLLKKHILRF